MRRFCPSFAPLDRLTPGAWPTTETALQRQAMPQVEVDPLTNGRLRQCDGQWQHDNAEAIANYNARIQREGLFADRYRTFMWADQQPASATPAVTNTQDEAD